MTSRRRAAGVDSQVDHDRQDHPAQRDHHRQRQSPPLAQLTHIELAARLQACYQEKERH